jgi:serine/threonine protein kinase
VPDLGPFAPRLLPGFARQWQRPRRLADGRLAGAQQQPGAAVLYLGPCSLPTFLVEQRITQGAHRESVGVGHLGVGLQQCQVPGGRVEGTLAVPRLGDPRPDGRCHPRPPLQLVAIEEGDATGQRVGGGIARAELLGALEMRFRARARLGALDLGARDAGGVRLPQTHDGVEARRPLRLQCRDRDDAEDRQGADERDGAEPPLERMDRRQRRGVLGVLVNAEERALAGAQAEAKHESHGQPAEMGDVVDESGRERAEGEGRQHEGQQGTDEKPAQLMLSREDRDGEERPGQTEDRTGGAGGQAGQKCNGQSEAEDAGHDVDEDDARRPDEALVRASHLPQHPEVQAEVDGADVDEAGGQQAPDLAGPDARRVDGTEGDKGGGVVGHEQGRPDPGHQQSHREVGKQQPDGAETSFSRAGTGAGVIVEARTWGRVGHPAHGTKVVRFANCPDRVGARARPPLTRGGPVGETKRVKPVGDYEIVRKLGEGGMGSVFLAQSRDGVRVVLKTPHRPTDELVARMGDEARTGFRLRHPHIVRTLDFFTFEERPVLVIEWIDGASLKELREEQGRLPPAMVVRVGEQISDALSTIHHLKDDLTGADLHMLHRDVTPGNIVISRDGDAKLIDLGIARSVESQSQKTAAGVLRGTFRYLSPDLFAGAPYSWMTDLWALGVSLFEAALGRRAIEGENAKVFQAVARGRLTELRPGEELHPMLRSLFDGLLAPDPEKRRFRDPEEVLHAFRVLRSRLGDGEAEARAILARVPDRSCEPDTPRSSSSDPPVAPGPPVTPGPAHDPVPGPNGPAPGVRRERTGPSSAASPPVALPPVPERAAEPQASGDGEVVVDLEVDVDVDVDVDVEMDPAAGADAAVAGDGGSNSDFLSSNTLSDLEGRTTETPVRLLSSLPSIARPTLPSALPLTSMFSSSIGTPSIVAGEAVDSPAPEAAGASAPSQVPATRILPATGLAPPSSVPPPTLTMAAMSVASLPQAEAPAPLSTRPDGVPARSRALPELDISEVPTAPTMQRASTEDPSRWRRSGGGLVADPLRSAPRGPVTQPTMRIDRASLDALETGEGPAGARRTQLSAPVASAAATLKTTNGGPEGDGGDET